jgi:hypothetical protein
MTTLLVLSPMRPDSPELVSPMPKRKEKMLVTKPRNKEALKNSIDN